MLINKIVSIWDIISPKIKGYQQLWISWLSALFSTRAILLIKEGIWFSYQKSINCEEDYEITKIELACNSYDIPKFRENLLEEMEDSGWIKIVIKKKLPE